MKQAEQQAGILVATDLLPLSVYKDTNFNEFQVSSAHHGWAPQRLPMFHAQLLVTWDRVLKVSPRLRRLI